MTEKMSRAALCTGLAAALLVTASVAGEVQKASPAGLSPRGVERRADEVLKAMSERLAGLERFAFEAEETFDEIPDGEPRMQLSNLRRVALERPNRVVADAEGDTLTRAVWYDGKTATILDKAHNTYGQAEVPPTIDAALDDVAERYGIVPPLVDLLYSDPYAVLTEGVLYGRYLGLHHVASVLCHHLVFVQETGEWQIWIDAGEEPLPRTFVITYVREPGEPQYSAGLRKWNVAPIFPEGLFTFEAPPGAERAEFSQFLLPDAGRETAGAPPDGEAGAGVESRPDGGGR